MTHKNILVAAILVLLAAAFVVHAVSLSFTQDDAFISYRYVKNFLDGKGLVFNPGERVEGYTNFLFVILMTLFGKLGLDYILFSKIVGIVSGLFLIGLSYFWGRQTELGEFGALSVPLLLAANGVFAYWSISGLETVLFSALIFSGLYLAARNNILFIPLLALATLTRPEGGLVFLLILAYYLAARINTLKKVSFYLFIYAMLIAPQVLFRLFYYHDILPNPFYAKTGLSLEYLTAGVKYGALFSKEYGFYGLILIVPITAFKLLSHEMRLLFSVNIIYIAYIIIVGGDVLHEHRFFVPILASLYLVFAYSTVVLLKRLFHRRTRLVGISFAVVLSLGAVATFILPWSRLMATREAEIALINKMRTAAEILNREIDWPYSLATTTIGAVSYYSHAKIIDMLGLTDRTIAKSPQTEIPGIESTWKERQYNIPYLMKLQPDFILFSTSLKPSAPAERALFLSSKFREAYYPVLMTKPRLHIYKLKAGFFGDDRYETDPRFVNLYVDAINQYLSQNFDSAIVLAQESEQLAPNDFYMVFNFMGEVRMAQGRPGDAKDILLKAFALSKGYSVQAALMLAQIYQGEGDLQKAAYYSKSAEIANRFK
ncbi:membrane hypothetical protein [Candidatus Zixiibacteriota bacterium]|nr:membrane hypothetical protein [candidate division Zixibacteria bacterium]